MNQYNDFNLPSEDNLLLMQDLYKSSTYNRPTTLSRLYQYIKDYLSQCYGLEKQVNARVRSAIEDIKKELELLNDNLILNFSYHYTEKIKNIKKFNLFTSLKLLNQILRELHLIEKSEEKSYYKVFACNTINQLLTRIENLYSSLETSFVYIFKHL